jgi:hypothetical protein
MKGPSPKPPEDLGTDGLRAFNLAVDAIANFDKPERYFDAVVAYARGVDMVESAWREWKRIGSPWTALNPNGAEGVHPQLKLIRDLEADAYRARRALKLAPEAIKKSGPGRPPGIASAKDRVSSPVVELNPRRREIGPGS